LDHKKKGEGKELSCRPCEEESRSREPLRQDIPALPEGKEGRGRLSIFLYRKTADISITRKEGHLDSVAKRKKEGAIFILEKSAVSSPRGKHRRAWRTDGEERKGPASASRGSFLFQDSRTIRIYTGKGVQRAPGRSSGSGVSDFAEGGRKRGGKVALLSNRAQQTPSACVPFRRSGEERRKVGYRQGQKRKKRGPLSCSRERLRSRKSRE